MANHSKGVQSIAKIVAPTWLGGHPSQLRRVVHGPVVAPHRDGVIVGIHFLADVPLLPCRHNMWPHLSRRQTFPDYFAGLPLLPCKPTTSHGTHVV